MTNPTGGTDRPLPGGVNAQHGQRRTNADKRQAIWKLLHDPEWAKWSDQEIARRCVVDHKSVASVRQELSREIPKIAPSRLVSRGGKTYEMRTDKIGEGQKKTKETAA